MCGGVLCRELERLEREQREKEAEEMRRKVGLYLLVQGYGQADSVAVVSSVSLKKRNVSAVLKKRLA